MCLELRVVAFEECETKRVQERELAHDRFRFALRADDDEVQGRFEEERDLGLTDVDVPMKKMTACVRACAN